MYASRTVCSRCSSQLRLAAAQRLGNRALYASQAEGQHASQPPSSTSSETEPHHATLSQRPRFAQKPFEVENDPALALFNDVVSHAAAPASKGVTRPALGELEIAGKINELMKKERLTVDKQYEIFENTMWPHILQISGRVPKSVFMAALQFLGEVRDGVIQETIKADSLELCQKISRLGKYDLDFRNDLIVALCFRLMKELKKADSTETAALLDELVKLWKHVSQLKRLGEVDKELRFMLPSAEEVLKDINGHRGAQMSKIPMHRTTKALSSIFLQYPPEQARKIVPGLVATLAVLSDPKVASTGTLEEMAPLLNLVGVAMNRSRPDNNFIASAFGVRSRVPLPTQSWMRSYIKNNWSRIKKLLSQDDGGQFDPDPASKHPEKTSTFMKISTFHSQLRTAYQAQNIGAVMYIWQGLNSKMERHPELAEQIKKDPDFMEYWIYVWCAIRRTHMVQETMQLMTKLGMEPTIKTYTAMMHGWKMCKDSRKIELLWKQLQNSGMKLDIVIHTERISSLIESGKPQQGIEALVAMVDDWKQACKEGRPDTAVKPTIEVVNAAFQGLIQRDAQAAHQVLAWAGGEGFVPNIRTYNILLRESFRSGNPGDVQELFAAMKKQDIEPDAATFTITLEEVLGRMGESTSAEQVQAVEQVFADIESAGLKPNMEMYGKMLYAVAYLAEGSDEAIAAVQDHMLRNGFKITPHMVTILIQRALSRDPPDIAAVRDLLHKHRLNNVGQGDQTLWERVMSAFAIAGEKEEALKIFDELADAGRPVTSLPCLTDLLKMLLANNDFEAAKHVVTVVLNHKGTEEEFKERYWRHHFWFLAKQNRLLTAEQAPHLFQARD